MEEEELETLTHVSNGGTQNPNSGKTITSHDPNFFSDDIDSTCSTPYVSAPSSPGRGPPLAGAGFFYSAPASPMHYMLSSSPNSPSNVSEASASGSFEFDFSARFALIGSASVGSMSSADELFLNGQIRPMKLSTHLQRPLEPLLDLEEEAERACDYEKGDLEKKTAVRGRDVILRDRSYRRRIRSLSPLRSTAFQWLKSEEQEANDTNVIDRSFEDVESKTTPLADAASSEETMPSSSSVPCSRSSSAGRSSKRWIFLKEFLYRSKSEGRNNGHKFWSSISFSPVKDKKLSNASSDSVVKDKAATATTLTVTEPPPASVEAKKASKRPAALAGRVTNGIGRRRRVPSPSAHELHYTANRAQAEEMRKKTFLPYRQGLLGCLGFSSKSYGAMNGFARALNPVSSR